METALFRDAASDPFRVMAYVKGVQVPLIVHFFAGRALTYNAANPDPFKVEMNNAGQHFYRWVHGPTGPGCG